MNRTMVGPCLVALFLSSAGYSEIGLSPPEVPACQFGAKPTHLLQTKASFGTREVIFFAWNNCANAKKGYLWSGYEIENGSWHKLPAEVQFFEAWTAKDADSGREYLVSYFPGSANAGTFLSIRFEKDRLVQEPIARVSSIEVQSFFDWLNGGPKLKILKRDKESL